MTHFEKIKEILTEANISYDEEVFEGEKLDRSDRELYIDIGRSIELEFDNDGKLLQFINTEFMA